MGRQSHNQPPDYGPEYLCSVEQVHQVSERLPDFGHPLAESPNLATRRAGQPEQLRQPAEERNRNRPLYPTLKGL